MKINKIAVSAFLIGIGTMASSLTYAEQENKVVDLNLNATVTAETEDRVNSSTSVKVEKENEVEESSTSSKKETNSDTEDKDNHSSMGDSHRSAVSTFVQNLLKVADREEGIGAEVKTIAQQQNDSEKTTTEAIVKVENRSGFKTFFVGSDYKNLGVLRSHVVITANQIDQLKKLLDRTIDSADKIELQAQIQVLEQMQVKINAFISKNENKFSLFGWMFNKKNK